MFAYVAYKNRADRVRISAKVMKGPRLADMMNLKQLPFDARRMFWGRFKTIVSL